MAPPHSVFATPTIRHSIADLASCTYRPDKVVAIAAEPSAFGQAIGLNIELRTSPATSPETIALVTEFWRQLGFEPSVSDQ
jgi:3-hydroxybutyryl-CoA dehydrogenase